MTDKIDLITHENLSDVYVNLTYKVRDKEGVEKQYSGWVLWLGRVQFGRSLLVGFRHHLPQKDLIELTRLEEPYHEHRLDGVTVTSGWASLATYKDCKGKEVYNIYCWDLEGNLFSQNGTDVWLSYWFYAWDIVDIQKASLQPKGRPYYLK